MQEARRILAESALNAIKNQSFLTGLMELMTGNDPVTSSLPTMKLNIQL